MNVQTMVVTGANANIVIIGCGISGIAAARRLFEAGFHRVRILEATERSGGRIKTRRLGDRIVEIGANWIHGPSEGNPVFCLARQYGLLDDEALTQENQAMDVGGHPPWVPNIFTSSGRKLNPEDISPALEMFFELMNESSEFHDQGGEPCASVGDFIRSEVQQRASELWKNMDANTRSLQLCTITTLLKAECCVNGVHSLDEVGLGAFGIYKTLPGLDCTFPGGYEGLIKNLMSELPSGVVTYNLPVRCVHWSNTEKRENLVMVECYLKKHQSTLFSPPLPLHKLHSVQRLGFGTNNKIFVEFDSPWWDADCEVIHFVWEDEAAMVDQVPDVQRSWIKKLFGFTVLKPTERYGHVLCGWIAGHESEYMETLSEQEVTQAVTQLIRRFTGNPTITPRRPLQVLFAGEATHPSYYSTVHGALLSGMREAERLITHYSSASPSQLTKLYQALRNVDKFRTVFDFGGREVAHWFPGHMAKGLKQMRASLRSVDCIIEIHDARISFACLCFLFNIKHIPFSGRNPVFQETLDVRPHVLILNKMDLADLSNKQKILKKLERDGVRNVLFTDCLTQRHENIKKLVPMVMEIIGNAPRFNRDENMNYCLMVIGVPNVGKSSLINSLRRTNLKKGRASRVGGEPGITKAVLTKIQDLSLSLSSGTILDHLVGEDVIADYLLYSLNRLGKFSYVEKYNLKEPSDDIQYVLKRIAVKLGKTQRVKAITGVGNITVTLPNYTAAAYDFIRAFRKGELGRAEAYHLSAVSATAAPAAAAPATLTGEVRPATLKRERVPPYAPPP
ncbi:hypothetical protein INR49_001042, partial [Caranx melampygus]